MRAPLVFSIVLLAIGFAACDRADEAGPDDVTPRDVDRLEPRPVTGAIEPVTRMVRAAPRVPLQPDPPETAGRLIHLAETVWRAGDFTFQFEPGGHLIVRGGHFDDIAEAGVPGRVVNRGGVLTFDILGRTSYGTWDGVTLTIENVEAHRLEPELAQGR